MKCLGALLVLASCASTVGITRTVLATGTLAYAVAADDRHIVSIELGERFELVVRSSAIDGEIAVVRRIDLGPPDTTIAALALGDGMAFVGGRDGWIASYDLASGEQRARWPQGAQIVELIVDRDTVIARDNKNVECTRRIADGALLACADVSLQPHARRTAVSWRGGMATWHGHDLTLQSSGATTMAHFGGEIQAATTTREGALIVAAWIAQLSDPALVLWRPVPVLKK